MTDETTRPTSLTVKNKTARGRVGFSSEVRIGLWIWYPNAMITPPGLAALRVKDSATVCQPLPIPPHHHPVTPLPTSSVLISPAPAGWTFSSLLNGIAAASLVVSSVLVSGCSQEAPIVTYQIPTTVPAALAAEDTRMVAAILPQTDQAWFFKVMGRKSAVDSVAGEFRKYVENIKFEGGEPVIGDLPPSWKLSGNRPMRFASIDINAPTEQLDLSISQLSRSDDWDALVTSNVNRWRGQVGLEPLSEKWSGAEELDWQGGETGTTETKPAAAIWVDVTGRPTSSGPSMMGSPMAGAPMMGRGPFEDSAAADGEMPADPHAGLPRSTRDAIAAKSSSLQNPATAEGATGSPAAAKSMTADTTDPASKLKFDRPEGWRDGKMSSMRLAAFNVGPETAVAEVTIISAGGNLRDNVARWMGQISKSVVPPEEVDAAFAKAEKLEIGGRPAQRFVLLPPEGAEKAADSDAAGDAATAIDGTVVPLSDDFAMFIKMTGPAETIRQQSEQMKSFLESLEF